MAHETSSWEELHLDANRLRLRTPSSRDAESLYDLFADAEVMHGLNRKPISAIEEARAMIEGAVRSWDTDGLGPFILETASTDRHVVGWAGLMIFDTRDWTPSTWANARSHAQPELGWALIRAHWGNGYATNAAAAIRDWSYESRAIERLVSLISPNNVRSQRVAKRLGAIAAEVVTPAHTERQTVVWEHRRPEDSANHPPGLVSRHVSGVISERWHSRTPTRLEVDRCRHVELVRGLGGSIRGVVGWREC